MSFLQFLKSKTFFVQIAIAIIGLLVFVFALKFWLGVTTNHNQKIQVPDLQKLSLEEVDRKLKELNLDFKIIDSASYNPEYPKKSVIEQTPQAGDFVKEKRKIYLTLNPSKYRDVTIPDLNGRTKRQASSQLQAIGLNVGTKFTYVSDIGKDVVRGLRFEGKIINPGDKLPLNSIVNLVLGDGNGR
ncbi:PASTA domain-containing protein [Polaribacter aestuariivivens]|uniref:PASTA domain-containing protein n=1 Tax=Polaribacter aestuariivivens TaxID=2304626 RepID=A0A5S3NE22_9FLAO|nr:PASTA domain-containing protein [Polaribacter aestuariivivens]TMM32019.1 PASTA domain-containing protein [Polaribacter aestuariivivens]